MRNKMAAKIRMVRLIEAKNTTNRFITPFIVIMIPSCEINERSSEVIKTLLHKNHDSSFTIQVNKGRIICPALFLSINGGASTPH